MTVRRKPVSVWIAVTSAPGSTPPLSSRTVPLICAVDPTWAETIALVSRTTSSPSNNARRARDIPHLLANGCDRAGIVGRRDWRRVYSQAEVCQRTLISHRHSSMRYVTFSTTTDPTPRLGFARGDRVVDAAA